VKGRMGQKRGWVFVDQPTRLELRESQVSRYKHQQERCGQQREKDGQGLGHENLQGWGWLYVSWQGLVWLCVSWKEWVWLCVNQQVEW